MNLAMFNSRVSFSTCCSQRLVSCRWARGKDLVLIPKQRFAVSRPHKHVHRQAARAEVAVSAPPKQAPKAEPVSVDGVDTIQLSPDVVLLRGVCSKRLKFEIEYGLKRGTTDNCYIIKGKKSSGNVLIDLPDEAFSEKFAAALAGAVPRGSIRTVVLTHLSPKRIPSLRALLQSPAISTPLDVHLSSPALQLLQSTFTGDKAGAAFLSKLNLIAARPDSAIDLGTPGEALSLIAVPTPRWPDLLVVYSPAARLLFSSKLFSAHVSPTVTGQAPGTATDTGGWDAFGPDWRNFFDCMLAPVARQASAALERLDVVVVPEPTGLPRPAALLAFLRNVLLGTSTALESGQAALFGQAGMGITRNPGDRMLVSGVAPMHGPVVRSSIAELIRSYRDWAAAQVAASAGVGSIAVLYASAYGNTAALAQALSRGMLKSGVGVETLNLELDSIDEVEAALATATAFVIGSPTLGGQMPTQVKTALGAILRSDRAKTLPCGVFGSFGWSGEAVDEMESRLKDAGFQFGFDTIRVKFKPTAKDLQVCEESGTDLAQAVLASKKKAAKQTSLGLKTATTSNPTEQAVGRLVGSLCVVTAKEEDASSAMLASWVSQASFDPPGISVAVKKDRAVDALLVRGSPFVLNMLAEGTEKGVMKQLLKPFKPGEDRFEGYEILVSETNGCAVLPSAASYVDCTVTDRMEAGDHWVVYATVQGGKVLQSNALSAVHHRKSGTSY